MKKTIAMMMTIAAMAAHTAYAVEWTGGAGNLLETPGNWEDEPSNWAVADAVFDFAAGATLTTGTGFTNRHTTATATGCAVTFAIPTGLEYFAGGNLTLNSVNPPSPYAYLFTGGGRLRIWNDATLAGDGNRVSVDGTTVYVRTMYVGRNGGSGNRLDVANSAVSSPGGFFVGSGANDNVVTLSGSALSPGWGLSVGSNGDGNALVFADGATMESTWMGDYWGDDDVATGITVGAGSGSSNSVLVTGGDMALAMEAINVGSGGSGVDNQFTVADHATVRVAGQVILNNTGNRIVLDDHASVSTPSRMLLIGAGAIAEIKNHAVLTTALGVSLGFDDYWGVPGSSNTLVVSDGGRLDGNLSVGWGEGDAYNAATFSGAGALLCRTNASGGVNTALSISGGGGTHNTAAFEDGAVGIVVSATIHGAHSALSVHDSILTNYGNMVVGEAGHYNRLCLSNAALIAGGMIVMGRNGGHSNALAAVGGEIRSEHSFYVGSGTGGNTAFLSGTAVAPGWGFEVGINGNGNALTFADGATVESAWLGPDYVVPGLNVGGGNGASNRVLVTGGDTVVAVSGFYVTATGGDNRLTVTDGATVTATNGKVGGEENRIVLDEGATVDVSTLRIVETGSSVEVKHHAALVATGVTLGYDDYWGLPGSSNTLVVSGGGRLEANLSVGWADGDTDNAATFSGAGTLLMKTNANGDATITLAIGKGLGGDMRNTVTFEKGAAGVVSSTTVSGTGNALALRDGAILTNAWTLTVRDGGTLCLSGDSEVAIESNLNVVNGATVRYTFGKVAPTKPIIVSKSGAPWPTGSDAVTLDIDAEKLSMAGGAKDIVLMQFAYDPGSWAWDPVTNNVTMKPDGCRLTLDGGTNLLLRVPGRNATRVIVR